MVLYWNYKDGNGTEAEGEKFDVNHSGIDDGFFCFEWRKNIHQHIAEIMGLFSEEH